MTCEKFCFSSVFCRLLKPNKKCVFRGVFFCVWMSRVEFVINQN